MYIRNQWLISAGFCEFCNAMLDNQKNKAYDINMQHQPYVNAPHSKRYYREQGNPRQ